MKCHFVFSLIFYLNFSVKNTQGAGFLDDFFQKFPHLPFAQVASVQDPSSVFEDLIAEPRVKSISERAQKHLPFAHVNSVEDSNSVFEDLITPKPHVKSLLGQAKNEGATVKSGLPVKRQLLYGSSTPKPVVSSTTIASMFYKKSLSYI